MVSQAQVINYILQIFSRFNQIIREPFKNIDVLWILIPLLVTLILLQVYFGRYKKETLGWNTAVGNSLALFFVGMNLFSWLYREQLIIGIFTNISDPTTALIKTLIAILVVCESIYLITINFFHLIPEGMAFKISSPKILNIIGIICIILVYSKTIPLDLLTLWASILLFIIILLVGGAIKAILPGAKEGKIFTFMGQEVSEKEIEKEQKDDVFAG